MSVFQCHFPVEVVEKNTYLDEWVTVIVNDGVYKTRPLIEAHR